MFHAISEKLSEIYNELRSSDKEWYLTNEQDDEIFFRHKKLGIIRVVTPSFGIHAYWDGTIGPINRGGYSQVFSYKTEDTRKILIGINERINEVMTVTRLKNLRLKPTVQEEK